MIIPIEIFVVAHPDGTSGAVSDEAELLGIIRSAADGCLVKAIELKVEMPAPGKAKAELVAPPAGSVHALAVA